MRIALFITGTTGSGKTTMLDWLGAHGWRTFSTGRYFRSRRMEAAEDDRVVAVGWGA